jgi:hypothetical protein
LIAETEPVAEGPPLALATQTFVPLDAMAVGALKDGSLTWVTVILVGGPVGMTWLEGDERRPAPTLFSATTVNEYAAPFFSLEIVHVVIFVVQVTLEGLDVAT